MTPKRVFRPRKRPTGLRDSKLIVIASEGTNTETKYFEDMASSVYFRNPRVYVEVLERPTTASSPSHVINMLNSFKKGYPLRADDELWLVIDTDRWPSSQLSSVAAECHSKKYHFTVSNPSFELWLLLHIKPITDYSLQEQQALAGNKKNGTRRTKLERELVFLLGSYNKSNLDTAKFLPFVADAVTRAKQLDTTPMSRWPHSLGTRVYLLAESIMNT